MDYIIHGILHFIAGSSCMAFLIINKYLDSKSKRQDLLIAGGVAGILPDVTKLFGDIFVHSLFIAPIIALLMVFLVNKLFKDLSLPHLWFGLTLSVCSHIFIDYIGNGVAPFFPFIEREFEFHIIQVVDVTMIILLCFILLTSYYLPKAKWLLVSIPILLVTYLGILSVSKLQLEYSLKKQYKEENVVSLLTYPSDKEFHWDYMIRTEKSFITGHSPIIGGEIVIEEKVDEEQ